jgi:acyl-[acyl-carrier-protein]-phospholipid O-acyltransferase / long-chain-fatty-acid--[acyl-carrier-protein] ligase
VNNMPASIRTLLQARRFGPLFITQFCGAINDNLFRAAMTAVITFQILAAEPTKAAIYAVLGAGVFILPFFFLSATAGQLADGQDKSWLIRAIKLFEVAIMALGAWALGSDSILAMMLVLLLLGVHSAFFGPIKYAILPQHLAREELLAGNGLIEAGTFIAVLIGLTAGTLLEREAAILGLVLALVGLVAGFFVPSAPAVSTGQPISLNFMVETTKVVRQMLQNRVLLLTTLGISWFWALGAVITSQIAPLTNGLLRSNQTVVVLLNMMFTLGIAAGAISVAKLLKGVISPRFVPISALMMTLFLFYLVWALGHYEAIGAGGANGVLAFLKSQGAWHILTAFFGLAAAGGAFTVPLYALLQTHAPKGETARMVAANNIFNALFMVFFALGATLLLSLTAIPVLLFLLALLNLVMAVLSCLLLPDAVVKSLLKRLFMLLYRVEVRGLAHYENTQGPALVVVNHVSFIDGLLLAAFLPGKPCFAVNTHIARAWWARPFLTLIDAFLVDPTNPLALKAMVKAVEAGNKLVIFPEGRITVTGALMKVFEGPAMVAQKADADIIPLRIEGAQYTPFSRLKGKVRLRWFPKITLEILPPRRLEPLGAHGEAGTRMGRQNAGIALYDMMSDLLFSTCNTNQSLFAALLDARAVHGARHPIVEDIERTPISYRGLIAGALALGQVLERLTKRQENVGVLLPNVCGVALTFFALHAKGRVPALLNFTAGSTNINNACRAASVKTLITARRFVKTAQLEGLIAELSAVEKILYLEDLRDGLEAWDKLKALLLTPIAGLLHKRHNVKADEPAVILFTSGSEGVPKGVVLSHKNLLANRYQLASRIDFNPTDVVFNALPVFHSFGLMGGTLLPILSGVKTMLYPSPLHYRVVPALAYDSNATIIFGTDTFLAGYARVAHPYDFYAVRYVFAGAEKVRDETRRVYGDKFGLRILEGYGATETAPVLALNTPMYYRAGSVGRLLPGITPRLEAVPGLATGARLWVKGPNVMAGYLLLDKPGVLQPPVDGWYDTGDIVSIDVEGFVRIEGRAKRFAKIAGEMVSLPALEAHVQTLWPDHQHAVLTKPDARKGEQLVLFTTNPQAEVSALLAHLQVSGLPELMVPKDIRTLEALPVLGTGKVDYVRLQAQAHIV